MRQLKALRHLSGELESSIRFGVYVTVGALAVLVAFPLLPGHGPLDRAWYVAVVAAEALVASAVWLLRRRLLRGRRAQALLLAWSAADVAAISVLVAITGGERSPLFALFALSCLFTAIYPWLMQAAVGLLAAGCYLAALAIFGQQLSPAFLLARLGTLALMMMMAGALARDYQASAREAGRRASLLKTVAATARNLISLSPEQVLDRVSAAAVELGYEATSISILSEDGRSYTLVHARGLPADYVRAPHRTSAGITAIVCRERRTVSIDDPHVLAEMVPALAGLRHAIGSPLWVEGRLAGVLIAGSWRRRGHGEDDLEAFELLASIAGQALEGARRYEQLTEREAQLERLNRRLAEDSRRDPLTGLRNRRALAYDLPRLEAEHRRRGERLALLVCDVDRFKAYNDRLGHVAGDQALRAVAAIVRGELRAEDRAYRYGGEEILVALVDAGPSDAERVGERLRAAVERAALPHPAGLGGVLTISVGAAAGRGEVATLLAHADEALYEAKRTGRNRVVLAPSGVEPGQEATRRRRGDRRAEAIALARAARRGGMPVLDAMAEIIRLELGWEVVAVNLRDPESDQAEVVLVTGDEEAREALLGTVNAWSELEALMRSGVERCGAIWVPAGASTGDVVIWNPPDQRLSDDPGAWDPGDMLLLPVRTPAGEVVALVSVDRPVDGLRPDEAALRKLMAIVDEAGLALAPGAGAKRPEDGEVAEPSRLSARAAPAAARTS